MTLGVAMTVGLPAVEALQVTATWDSAPADATGIKVERSTDGLQFVEIATVAASATSFTDTNLPAGNYWYRVRAFNSTTQSSYSNVLSLQATATDVAPTSSPTNSPASVSAAGTSTGGRLANASIRAVGGTGDQVLIVGFVIGDGSKSVLIRAVGPGLAVSSSVTTFADPKLIVYDGSQPILSNDNWGGTAELKSAFAQTGASALSDTSKDAAILAKLPAKPYTAQVSGSGAGMVLAEIYDADFSSGRLINIAARAQVGTGDSALIAGFVVAGNAPERVLIRAVGPALGAMGVSGVLSSPQINLYQGSTLIQHNEAWGGTSALSTAFSQTGAFALTDPNSKDAALLVTLDPGAYSAVVSGTSNTTGVALIEVYEVP